MPGADADILAHLAGLLAARTPVTRALLPTYPAGWTHPDNFVSAPKLLLVRRGTVNYVLDGVPIALRPGMMFYRPAWTRSHWNVMGRGGCAFSYCEYDPGQLAWHRPLVVRVADLRAEAAVLDRIHYLHHLEETAASLEAEGELKGVLARFFCRAAGTSESHSAVRPAPAAPSETALQAAVNFLGRNYAQPDIITGLPERVGLSDNHFRLLFKRRLGVSAQRYVLTLRMRAARHYLAQSSMAIKQVAVAVGYADPLYFSRLYADFWGHPPSDDRGTLARPPQPPPAGR